MIPLASILLSASAMILLLLGALHLLYTFRGDKLRPRDEALEQRMREVSPRITRETTMWKTWIGFNASHSFGAILFGSIYGYLALAQGALLFRSPFLLAVGFLLLSGYFWLGLRYWFSVPFRGIALATALYLAALVTFLISGSP
jgi:hypothetical protein